MMERYGNKVRFIILIGGSIATALTLVFISISLYFSSGTAQVDLSRPGYQSVRDQTPQEAPYRGFSSSGTVTQETLDEFDKLYQERSKKAKAVDDAFSGEVLSDAALSINDVGTDSIDQGQ